MLFLPFRTYNTDNKKSEDSKDLMSIESSLYYFACLVLLLQILQKSIVTLAIIYKFGGYKEKDTKYFLVLLILVLPCSYIHWCLKFISINLYNCFPYYRNIII